MNQSITVQMARAYPEDLRAMIAFFHVIDEYMDYGTYTPESDEVEEESIELDHAMFVAKLRELWDGPSRLARGIDCCWTPIVMGYDVLVTNCCDPEADVLAWKPEIAAAIAEKSKSQADAAAVPELVAALRELHDFAEPTTQYRHRSRSAKAFERAAELLQRMESA